MEKSEQEKAQEVVKKRERNRKGFADTNDRGKDPLAKQKEKADKVAQSGLALGLGMKRTG